MKKQELRKARPFPEYPLHKLTNKHIKKFKEYLVTIGKDFGLQGWEVNVTITEKLNDNGYPDYRACTLGDGSARVAVIGISRYLDVEPTDYWLSRTAFHEIWELLFTDIEDSMKGPVKFKRTLVHTLIRTLENTLFDFYFEKVLK